MFQLLTERLLLRPHEEADADFMVELNTDPEVTRFTPDGPLAGPEAALQIIRSLQRQFEDQRMGRFIVLHRESGAPIGWCGLKRMVAERNADLGYRFLQRWWGQGLASEAARACVHYGFEDLELNTLTAEVEDGNQRSRRVLEKLGFRPTSREGKTQTWELRRKTSFAQGASERSERDSSPRGSE